MTKETEAQAALRRRQRRLAILKSFGGEAYVDEYHDSDEDEAIIAAAEEGDGAEDVPAGLRARRGDDGRHGHGHGHGHEEHHNLVMGHPFKKPLLIARREDVEEMRAQTFAVLYLLATAVAAAIACSLARPANEATRFARLTGVQWRNATLLLLGCSELLSTRLRRRIAWDWLLWRLAVAVALLWWLPAGSTRGARLLLAAAGFSSVLRAIGTTGLFSALFTLVDAVCRWGAAAAVVYWHV